MTVSCSLTVIVFFHFYLYEPLFVSNHAIGFVKILLEQFWFKKSILKLDALAMFSCHLWVFSVITCVLKPLIISFFTNRMLFCQFSVQWTLSLLFFSFSIRFLSFYSSKTNKKQAPTVQYACLKQSLNATCVELEWMN